MTAVSRNIRRFATQRRAMTGSDSLSGNTESTVPWWVRYTRWCSTSEGEAIISEANLLKLVKTQLEVRDVPVGPSKDEYLHTLSGGAAGKTPLVFMPGYAAGVGFFYRNFDDLCGTFRTHAVDWLGTGLSGRPKYTADTREKSEAFFIESLERWRVRMGLDKFVLMGHSLGGYLAATYALQHPDKVEHLVLVCPAGIPRQPEDWESKLLSPRWSMRTQLLTFFRAMWVYGYTPGSFIRGLGPIGQNLVYKYVGARFGHHGQALDEKEAGVFREYVYQTLAARGSGEYALRHLLAPGAWAHAPLWDRLHELKVPVTFIYGEHDWMLPRHAQELCAELRRTQAPRCSSDLSVRIIPEAGHFVFLEQPKLFDNVLKDVLSYLRK